MRLLRQAFDELWPFVLAGVCAGLAGALLFAAAHAALIVPIWSRMGSGPFAGALTGAAAGWLLAELHPTLLTAPARDAAATGVRFGGALWLLVSPVTAVDALLRAVNTAPEGEIVEVVVAVAIAIGAGGIVGWLRTRRLRGAAAAAAATLVLTVAMAGPVPVARSPRALGIFLAVLPVAALSGGALALLARWLFRLRALREAARGPVTG